MVQLHGNHHDEVTFTIAELDHILQLQHDLFPRVINDSNYIAIIDDLCLAAERLLPHSVASVMLLSQESYLLNVISSPSISDSARAALENLKPGPFGGSCGNAVYNNQPVFIADTLHDKRWETLHDVAKNFDICACWSMPIRNTEGKAIGSFALSSFEPRSPSNFHKRLLEVCASIVSIVLERQTREQLLQKRNHQLQVMNNALKQTQELFLILDTEHNIIDASQAVESICGYPPQKMTGRAFRTLLTPRYSSQFINRIWLQVEKNKHWQGEVRVVHYDQSEADQWLSISQTDNQNGDNHGYVAVFTNLSEIQRNHENLVNALKYDQLTGLKNRAKLLLALQTAEPEASLLILNLNGFSDINIAYGVDFADHLLICIAEVLQRFAQKNNLFRINADEFALLLPKHIDLQSHINTIREYFFNNTVLVDNLNLNIMFTYGGVEQSYDLLSKALQALRKAKRLGKNCFHIYENDIDDPDRSQHMNRIEWGLKLHEAITQDYLVPYFQGIRDNRTGNISHYEALVRLDDGQNIYNPFHFLPTANIAGLLPTITRIIIDKSFAHIAQLPVTLSLNITEADLNECYLANYLNEKTQYYQIDPQRITLEILESISADGKSNHIQQLMELKSYGYHLAIDDFGTEYSNFERILELQVEKLKIDAKYIRNIVKDKTSREIVRAMVFFAKNTGIVTTAEYVCEPEIQAVVETLGIEYSQGYLFSEPSATIDQDNVSQLYTEM